MLHEIKQNARLQLPGQRRVSGIPLDTQRRPQCALLMGEAGIGKTRLAEEVSREAQRNGWSIIWSRVYPQESGIPYRIWTDVLRKVIELVPGSGRSHIAYTLLCLILPLRHYSCSLLLLCCQN